MKKIMMISAQAFVGLCALTAAAQNDVASISRIADMQWKVEWNSAASINPLNAILDDVNPVYRVILAGNGGEETYLYYQKEIIFPTYGNYFTVNLEKLDLPEGEYDLTVPAGYVALVPGIVPNSTQYLTLTVGGMEEISHKPYYSPVEGSVFNIYWENVTSLAPGDTSGAYIENLSTGEKYDMHYLKGTEYSKANLRIEGDCLRVTLTANYPDLPDGIYRLYLPAGYVKFNGSEIGNDAIDGYEFSYTAPWTEGPVEINGPSEDGLITLEWENASAVEYNEDYAGDGWGTIGVCIYDGADVKAEVPYPSNISFSGNVMTIDINDIWLATGQCQLVVPDGCIYVTVNGVTNLSNGMAYRFMYVNPDEPDVPDEPEYPVYTVNAGWSVRNGDTVSGEEGPLTVNWGGVRISPVENPGDEVSVYGGYAGYRELKYGEDVVISEDGTKLMIYVSDLPSDTYRVNVPEGYVYIEADGKTYINMATSLDNLTVNNESGVGVITEDNETLPVVLLNGIRVKDASGGKGIYVIGGKKVLRR